ncbi:MAG: electron transfer flavoprotein subunit alpha/FixB family protein [Bacteroidota bacterium]|nr:electron transfer flavoprotein subunit alpha/FixB family protein [Bacteroidota bacterium]
MILAFIELKDGQIKKSGFELLTFASQLSVLSTQTVTALVIGEDANFDIAGHYGAKELLHISCPNVLTSSQYTDLIEQVAKQEDASYVLLSNSSLGKAIAGSLSVKLNKALISAVCSKPEMKEHISFKKNVFSGKAFAWYSTKEDQAVITLMPKSFPPVKVTESACEVRKISLSVPESKIKLINRNMVKGKIPLTESDVVVSAGRGMKDPSNWGMIEELADLLGAATACSRPVADIGWRPHHEHVGQTGTAIRPNLYIAIGISGAIQHLAGVNNSRKIIVINKDPEAPFFKAADYGICGDLFEIVPKLNEAIKKFKHE